MIRYTKSSTPLSPLSGSVAGKTQRGRYKGLRVFRGMRYEGFDCVVIVPIFSRASSVLLGCNMVRGATLFFPKMHTDCCPNIAYWVWTVEYQNFRQFRAYILTTDDITATVIS
jgi:hypothetical protein